MRDYRGAHGAQGGRALPGEGGILEVRGDDHCASLGTGVATILLRDG